MDQSQVEIHAHVDTAHWWWRARRDIIEATIAKHAPERRPLRIAEVGCCTGGNLEMLSRFGNVIGTDPSPDAVAHLKATKFPHNVTVAQHAIPEPLPGPFDVLCLFDVLEHIEDDRGAFRWVAENTAKDGIAVVTVPAFGFLWTEQDEAVLHLRRYTPRMLASIVPPELEIVHLTAFNTWLFLPILAARTCMNLLRRRDRAPKSHLGAPPEPLNEFLYRLMRSERPWVVRSRFPLGVSLLLVAKKR